MKRYPPAQGEVLDTVIKALNTERGAKYMIAGRPDEVERNRPEVDYILRDDARPPEIAAEVSSTWRSDGAGKEDANWLAWAETVRALVRGKAPAEFRISTPLTIPRDLKADDFAAPLVRYSVESIRPLRDSTRAPRERASRCAASRWVVRSATRTPGGSSSAGR